MKNSQFEIIRRMRFKGGHGFRLVVRCKLDGSTFEVKEGRYNGGWLACDRCDERAAAKEAELAKLRRAVKCGCVRRGPFVSVTNCELHGPMAASYEQRRVDLEFAFGDAR